MVGLSEDRDCCRWWDCQRIGTAVGNFQAFGVFASLWLNLNSKTVHLCFVLTLAADSSVPFNFNMTCK